MEGLLKEKIEKFNLCQKKVVVAVSGGVDSVVLLDFLAKNIPRENIVVAHFNHGVRKDSQKEEDLVRNLAKKHNLVFFYKQLLPEKKDEAYLRQKRYAWLRSIRAKSGSLYILTAHHLDDQVETVLLNLVRGSGPLALWGMDEERKSVLRLMMGVSKKEILAYAKKQGLKYLEDVTNMDLSYRRNWIRAVLIPEIEKKNPSFKKTLQKNINIGFELRSYIKNEVGKLERVARNQNKLKLSLLKSADSFIAKELIKKMLHEYIGPSSDIYGDNVDSVYSLIEKEGSKKTELKGITVVKDYEWLFFGENEVSFDKKLALKVGDKIVFNEHVFSVKIGKAYPCPNNVLLPLEFSDSLEIRTWQKGDKIVTKTGTKKLQDIFVDAKISKAKRGSWPILASGDRILWLPGLNASVYAKKEKINLIIEVR